MKLIWGDSLLELEHIEDNSIDTIITDPPYGLSFMGKKWDYDVPGLDVWLECLRVLKPGGTALIFAGSRTYHRMAVRVEDSGFLLKDCIMWLYGSGFPKATDISKQLDKGHERRVIGVSEKQPAGFIRHGRTDEEVFNGTDKEREPEMITEPATPEAKLWNGWKSHGLKPAYESIIVAMKPNDGTYAQNTKHGVSGLNIDGGRIGTDEIIKDKEKEKSQGNVYGKYSKRVGGSGNGTTHTQGRFPANVILECLCDEVIEGKAGEKILSGHGRKSTIGGNGKYQGGKGMATVAYKNERGAIHTNSDCPCYILDEQSGESKSTASKWKGFSGKGSNEGWKRKSHTKEIEGGFNDKGGASRFFYCAKSSKAERNAGCEGLEERQTTGGGGGIGDYKDDVNSCSGKYGSEKAPANNNHPTVKPLKLMEYLCTLTKTPTGGIVLDPFMGSGTTGIACVNTGRDFIGIEQEYEYLEIAKARIEHAEKHKQEILF